MKLLYPNRLAPEGRSGVLMISFGGKARSVRIDPARFCGNAEPTLDELLEDDILHLVLARDRIAVSDISEAILSWRGGLCDDNGIS